jgi:PAS domain S-box-containing protein
MSARGRDKVPHSRRIEGSSEGLDTLLEWAPDAMVVIDTAGRIVMVNRRTEEMFGYSRDELIAQPIEKLIPLHLGTRHAEHVQSFFADPSNRRMGTGRELTGLSATGLEFPVEISLSPVEMENDELVVGSMRDISSRKQAESQLRKANAQADTALALSKAVCFEVAPDMQHFTASDSYVEIFSGRDLRLQCGGPLTSLCRRLRGQSHEGPPGRDRDHRCVPPVPKTG